MKQPITDKDLFYLFYDDMEDYIDDVMVRKEFYTNSMIYMYLLVKSKRTK